MGIIKTPEFNKQLEQDIELLRSNRKRPLDKLGSYFRKPMGSLISDIDFTDKVVFRPGINSVIARTIERVERSRKFRFVRLKSGELDGYSIPWKIDTIGGCKFDLQETLEWVKHIKQKGIISQRIINEIENTLKATEGLRLRDLLRLELMLKNEGSIQWNLRDIEKGYIEFNGKQYTLLDSLQSTNSIIKYIYVPRPNIFVPIDVALKDYKYYTPRASEMYRYYIEDTYLIIKRLWWAIKTEHVDYYRNIMASISSLVSLSYETDLLDKLDKFRLASKKEFTTLEDRLIKQWKQHDIPIKGKNIKEISDTIKHRINSQLDNVIAEIIPFLKDKDRKVVQEQLTRGIEAQILVSRQDLLARSKSGMECPFFLLDIQEFKTLRNLAERLELDWEIVSDCFIQIGNRLNLSPKNLVNKAVGKNILRLESSESGQITVFDGQTKLGTFDLSLKKYIQLYILTRNVG
jgi:type III secretion system FlhB-like substrate exporter